MRLRTALLGTTLMAAAPAVAMAQPVVGPYVSLGGGYTIQQDIKSHFSPTTFADGTEGANSSKYRFKNGYTGEASFGYGMANGLRIELEGLYMQNEAEHRGRTPVPGYTNGHSEKYGPMVNVLYDLNLEQFGIALPVTPYVGVGAGYLWTHLSPLSTVYDNGDVNRVGGTQGAFAYQGIVGVAYNITQVPGLAVTAEYRFLSTTNSLTGSAFQSTAYTPSGIHKGNADFNDNFDHSFMLGIRYAFETAPPPPPPAPVVAPAPAPARTYLVFFDWDKSNLSDRARQIIAEAAQASTRVQTTRIEVNGYTDTSAVHPGPRGERYNMGLSIRRAESVKAELIRDGVPEGAIETQGFGETHPLVPTGPDTREAQNRRVEIILH